MGGSGSGRHYRWDKKSETTDYLSLPISKLKQAKFLKQYSYSEGTWRWLVNGKEVGAVGCKVHINEFDAYVRFKYFNKSQNKDYDYKVYLSSTDLHLGGKRWWFQCPLKGCFKRVSILYLANMLACRHCLNLAYPSQNEAPHYRILSKAQKKHSELGGSGRVDDSAAKFGVEFDNR